MKNKHLRTHSYLHANAKDHVNLFILNVLNSGLKVEDIKNKLEILLFLNGKSMKELNIYFLRLDCEVC